MALSFQEIQDLVEEAIAEKYPPIKRGDDEPYEYAHRYIVNRCWDNEALLRKCYFAAESDPNYALIQFTIGEGSEENGTEDSAILGELIPMQLQVISTDGKIKIELESEHFDDYIDEAGRRNSKTDAHALNSAIRSIVSLLTQEDLDEETISSINKIILQPTKTKENDENSEAWDGSKSRFSIDQLLRSVPRAMARWARAQAKKNNREVVKGDLHLPYKEPGGAVNPNGVRNALARLSQVKGVPSEVVAACKRELERALNRINKGNKESEKEDGEPRKDILSLMQEAREIVKAEREKQAEQDLAESFVGEGEIFTETIFNAIEGNYDAKNMVIKGHVVLGPLSKNGYRYPVATQKESITIFEGAKAYLNHPKPSDMAEARDIRDMIGSHQNVRVDGDKTYSDLHLIDNKTVQDYVLPIVESKDHLRAVGSSVVIRGKMKKVKDDLPEIEKIYACRSIDLVSEPATTSGLYESHHAKTEISEENMELKDLTLDQLKKERSDLVEQILASIEEGKKVANLESQAANLQTKLKEADEKIAKLELQIANRDAIEAKRQVEMEIEELVREAKIPDAVKYEEKDGKKAIKSHFRNLLTRCESTDERKALVADWEESCKGMKTESKVGSRIVSYEQHLDSAPITESALEKLYNAISH